MFHDTELVYLVNRRESQVRGNIESILNNNITVLSDADHGLSLIENFRERTFYFMREPMLLKVLSLIQLNHAHSPIKIQLYSYFTTIPIGQHALHNAKHK